MTDIVSTSVIERNKVFEYVKAMLGSGMLDLDLDPIHYETALDKALNRYRQRSSNAVEESYSFLELIANQNEYRLPDEIIEVRVLYRRAIGSRTGMGAGGTVFEPFNRFNACLKFLHNTPCTTDEANSGVIVINQEKFFV